MKVLSLRVTPRSDNTGPRATRASRSRFGCSVAIEHGASAVRRRARTRTARGTHDASAPGERTKGRAHPTRRCEETSDNKSPRDPSRRARAERGGCCSHGGRDERSKGCSAAVLGAARIARHRPRRGSCDESGSRTRRRGRRLAPDLRRASGAMHTARLSDQRSGSHAGSPEKEGPRYER